MCNYDKKFQKGSVLNDQWHIPNPAVARFKKLPQNRKFVID